MRQIISADLKKLYWSKASKMTILLFLLINVYFAASGSRLVIVGMVKPLNPVFTAINVPLMGLSTSANLILYLLPIYIVLIADDYTGRVLFNVCSHNFSKTKYLLSKLFTLTCINVLMISMLMIVPYIVGLFVYDKGNIASINISDVLLVYLSQIIIFTLWGGVVLLASRIVRNKSYFIITYILCYLFGNSVYMMSFINEGMAFIRPFFIQNWLQRTHDYFTMDVTVFIELLKYSMAMVLVLCPLIIVFSKGQLIDKSE